MTLKELREMEKVIVDSIEKLKGEINDNVSKTEIDGVKRICDSPVCVAVKLSTISRHGGILAAECYIQQKQAEYVAHALRNINTVEGLENRLRDMVEEKRVKFGSNYYYLNEETVGVLSQQLQSLFL